jgi:hypothetical protein
VLSLDKTAVSLLSAAATTTVTATEPTYTGALTVGQVPCAGIAGVTPASGTGPSAVFTVTAIAAGGPCTVTIADSHAQQKTFTITVTTTSVGGN